MIRPSHETITSEALSDYFNSSTIDLIKESNVNSDGKKARAVKSYDVNFQHSNKSSIGECAEFVEKAEQTVIDDFIKAAKISDDNKDDESYMQAFYDLGRLTHSLQDFYSHTNWINQTGNNVLTWDETANDTQLKHPEKLKTAEYRPIKEFFQRINPFSGWSLKKGKNYKETYVEKETNVSHFKLNKDEPGTIADKAFKATEGVSGYELAYQDAKKHTEKKWNEILGTLKEQLSYSEYNELLDDIENFKPTVENIDENTKEKKLDTLLKDYRIDFDNKMSN